MERDRASSIPRSIYIDETVEAVATDWIPATVFLREMKVLGYAGWYSVLKDHLVRPAVQARATDSVRDRQSPAQFFITRS